MSDDQNPQWLQDLTNITAQFRASQTPESQAAGKRHSNQDMLVHLGVSQEHVKRVAEIAQLIGTQTPMSHAEAHDWVTGHIYSLLRGGGKITDETFQDLLKRAGITS
jgi:hypothetical protein